MFVLRAPVREDRGIFWCFMAPEKYKFSLRHEGEKDCSICRKDCSICREGIAYIIFFSYLCIVLRIVGNAGERPMNVEGTLRQKRQRIVLVAAFLMG